MGISRKKFFFLSEWVTCIPVIKVIVFLSVKTFLFVQIFIRFHSNLKWKAKNRIFFKTFWKKNTKNFIFSFAQAKSKGNFRVFCFTFFSPDLSILEKVTYFFFAHLFSYPVFHSFLPAKKYGLRGWYPLI